VNISTIKSLSYPTRKYSTLPQLINKFQTPISAALPLSGFVAST